jgi:hypothetical protein
MHTDFLNSPSATPAEAPDRRSQDSASRVGRIGLIIMAVFLIVPPLAGAQSASSASPVGEEAQSCGALMELNLENAPGGPAFVTSAQLMDVPTIGLNGRRTRQADMGRRVV